MGMRTYGRMSLVIWARCSETLFGGDGPGQPEGEGVGLVLGRPTVDTVLVEAFEDEAVDEAVDVVGEIGCVELVADLTVVFQEHGSRS
jgi:hypothetical protein